MENNRDKLTEIIFLLTETKTTKELIQKINSSKILDLDRDFEIICDEIKTLKPKKDFIKFLIEINNIGRVDLLEESPYIIGVTDFFKLAAVTKSIILKEYILKNFKELNNYINSKENYISEDEFKNDLKIGISWLIKLSDDRDKIKIINKMIETKWNIEDFLQDFLDVPNNNDYMNKEQVIFALQRVKGIDNIELLQAIIKNNDKLIDSFSVTQSDSFIFYLNSILEIANKIEDSNKNKKELIGKLNKSMSDNFRTIVLRFNYNEDVIEKLRNFNIKATKFKSIQDDVISVLSGASLVKYIQSEIKHDEFEKNWTYLDFTKELLKNPTKEYDKVSITAISILIKEICEHQNLGIKDIEFGQNGHFNFNLKIGEYYIKIGREREIKEIRNDRRIIKPLLRQNLNIEDKDKRSELSIEIQNAVDANWYKGLSRDEIEEELYELFSDLRSRGLVWTDIKKENVGRLLKPNKENFETEVIIKDGKIERKELKSSNYTVGFYGDEPEEIAKPGELVIIDTDYIFEELRQNAFPRKSLYEKFDKRYIKELREKGRNIKSKFKKVYEFIRGRR